MFPSLSPVKLYFAIGVIAVLVISYFVGHSNGVDDCRDEQKLNSLTMTEQSAGKLATTERTYDDFQKSIIQSPLYGQTTAACPVAPIIKYTIDSLPDRESTRK